MILQLGKSATLARTFYAGVSGDNPNLFIDYDGTCLTFAEPVVFAAKNAPASVQQSLLAMVEDYVALGEKEKHRTLIETLRWLPALRVKIHPIRPLPETLFIKTFIGVCAVGYFLDRTADCQRSEILGFAALDSS